MSNVEKQDLTPPSDGAVAVVPAAGRAVRFGGGKLIADVRGEPLLNHTLRSLLDSHAFSRIIVVVAPGAELSVVTLLDDPRVECVVNPDPDRGMFSSIQIGFEQAGRAMAVLVLPADMPFVMPETVEATVGACVRSGLIAVATLHGRHGHPLAMPRAAADAVIRAPVDQSLKDVLKSTGMPQLDVDVVDPGVLRDVDVRGDLDI